MSADPASLASTPIAASVAPAPAGVRNNADPFAVLPNDVLSTICSFLPLRPRLAVVSMLSKRWRACALRSLTDLGMMEFEMAPARVARLPSIASMCARSNFAAAELPSTLRSLSIAHSTGLEFDDRPPDLPRLDCIKCFEEMRNTDDVTKAWRRTLTEFVPKYGTRLQELWLHGIPSPALADAVRHYPRLATLSFSFGYSTNPSHAPEMVGQLLALHAEQLTELSLGVADSVSDELTTLQPLVRPMPRLRKFSFCGDKSWLLALAALAPPACQVSYTLFRSPLTADLCPFVSCLNFKDELAHPELLARCTNLRQLDLSGLRDAAAYMRHALPPSVRKLTIKNSAAPPAEWLAPLASLKRLKMDALPPSLCTASLVHVCIDWMPYVNSERGLLALCDVITACPRLAWFGSHWVPHRRLVVADMEALARFAEARGVEEISLQVAHSGAQVEACEAKLEALRRLEGALRWLKLHLREYTVCSGNDYDDG